MESMARREAKETKENTVPLVPLAHKALSEPLVLLVLMENLVLEVSRVCLVRREMKDPEGSPDLPAPLDCRVCLDLPVRKERQEMLARWVPLVHLAPEDPPDPQERTAPRDPLEALETLVLWERRVTQARLENQVFREKSVHQVQEESEERRERLVLPVLVDLPVPKVPLETMVPKEAQVLAVSLVILVPLESLVRLV